ncbi:MAG: nucleoside triphosphate pyrophosphohydrolase [Calditrichia bacterium]
MNYLEEFKRLVEIMARLRRECPWDKKQTPQSLRQYVLEEAYETVEAIDEENWDELKKELGDLTLQVVFQAEIARENQRFTLEEVLKGINEKLIRRHPHVFGDVQVQNAEEVKENWEQIKFQQEDRASVLDGIPKNISGLLRAQRIQDKAAQVGFDWEDPIGILQKIKEEAEELETASRQNDRDAMEAEIGDLMFSLVNLCRHYQISAEDALRRTNNKFIARFHYIEARLKEMGKSVYDSNLEEMDQLWNESKQENH